MSQALRKLTGTVARSQCMIFFTNQIRMKIGVMFGNPETTPGGNALKFYASLRLDVRRIGAIKDASQSDGKEMVVVGNRTRVKVVKNKLAPPFREVEFDILYGTGISRSGEVVDMAVDEGALQKSGAWYSLNGERIGQGRETVRRYLEEHADVLGRLEQAVLERHGITRRGHTGPAPEQPSVPAKGQRPAAEGSGGGASRKASRAG
jgi:recombination protein RecA